MKVQDLKPGRIYSVIYINDVPMVAKRDGQTNPLIDCQVTVRRMSTVQAAGGETWANFKRKTDADWMPSNDSKSWYHEDASNSCILVHNKVGTRYLRALPRGVTKEEYFIGNAKATDKEVETIKSFAKSQSQPSFVTLKLSNLINVVDCLESTDKLNEAMDIHAANKI